MMNTIRLMTVLLLLMSSATSFSLPGSYQFTYQGKLFDGGTPANGLYDFEFTLYDSAVNGSILAIQTMDDIQVVDGIFSTQIDFTDIPDLFEITQVWIEARVGEPDTALTLMEPRTEVKATAQAFYSSTAELALTVNESSITSLEIEDGSIQADDINTAEIQQRLSGACGQGYVMTSVNEDGSVQCSRQQITTDNGTGSSPVCFNESGELFPCSVDYLIPNNATLIGTWTGQKIYDRNSSGSCFDDEVTLQIIPYISSGPQLKSLTTRRAGGPFDIDELTNEYIQAGFITAEYEPYGIATIYTISFNSLGEASGDWSDPSCFGTWSFAKNP
ncbi:hypothetical protein [Marinicella rhabdoformis]|uniref:hypothetical protein n=1 Tax=Marinicella rhabdoformis TaxID=2580566 RepID=UPI0012AECD19|nr:hypothetical protein [Marinicella rhabdoformis]